MGAVPAPPWFPASGGGGGGARFDTARLITVASALRLGSLLRCSDHLHRLLRCSTSPEGCHFDNLYRINDVWWRKPWSPRRCSLREELADIILASCSSCASFFSGEDSKKSSLGHGDLRRGSSQGIFSNRRLWTYVLLALNVSVYVAQFASKGRLTLWGAKVNGLIDKGQYWRLVTSSFLHANLGHLMVNCYSLNSIGPIVEQLTGPRRFLAVYFTSAVASSVMSYWFCQLPAVGASGAIFGLMGSFAVFILRHRSLYGRGMEDIQHVARIIALNMVIGILSKGIDNWGHLGGLLGGAALSWFLGPVWKFDSRTSDGRAVFVDMAPIVRLTNRRRID